MGTEFLHQLKSRLPKGLSYASLPVRGLPTRGTSFREPWHVRLSCSLRRATYKAGRMCAHRALKALILSEVPYPLPKHTLHEYPLWPAHVRGSITHTNHYALSVVGLKRDFSWVGVDLEHIPSSSLSSELKQHVGKGSEWSLLKEHPEELAFTLLFSAKEALYKALFPLFHTFLDFTSVQLVSSDESSHELFFIVKEGQYLPRKEIPVSYALHPELVVTWCT